MRNMSSISDRVVGEAVEAYLGREGMVIAGHCCSGIIDFMCVDAQTQERVFVAVTAGDGVKDGEEDYNRATVESEMIHHVAQAGGEIPAGKLRFDAIHIFVTSEGKGVLRHHRAAL